MKKILVLAVFLRLLVAGFLFHPDIKTINFQASFLKKGIFNIYPFLIENRNQLPLKEEFVYFPLTYFSVGGYQALISPLMGENFDKWLSNADSFGVVNDPNIFGYLLILKLPLLILDLVIAYLIMQFFKDKDKAKKALIFWLFNPFTIYIIYGFSNVDIFPVVLTLLAFLFFKKEKLKLGASFLGLAAGFKLYPLLFTPFLVLRGKNLKEKFLLGAIPFLVFGLISLPFLSSFYVQSTLVSGLTTRIFNPGFSVGFNESIIVGLFLISALFFYAWLTQKEFDLFNYWTVMFLAIFAFSHFHIAWLLWLAPFVIILAVKNEKLSWPLFLMSVACVLIPLLYADRSMSISLFRAYSTWFDLLPTPFSILQKFYDPYNLQSIFHSLFAGGVAVVSYLILRKENKK